jgi:2,4-dienoyl-CoA reductase-like NADH-dependent reductase (Old Yellow Enzyme family)
MAWRTYESLLASNSEKCVARLKMGDTIPQMVEDINAPAAAQVKKHVRMPIICTGGFQTADGILRVLQNGSCDAASIARPLLANPDLPKLLVCQRYSLASRLF